MIRIKVLGYSLGFKVFGFSEAAGLGFRAFAF